LLGSSALASSSITLVADGLAWAHMDNDSVETDTASVHVDSDGMVTSVLLGPDGTINSISQFFSFYTDCQPVLFKNHFCLSTGESSMFCMAASNAHGLGFSLACTEQSLSNTSVPCEEYGDRIPVQHYAELPPFVWGYYAKGISTSLMKQAKGLDQIFQCIGIGSDLRSWMATL
jgi:hypothetical protein